MASFVELVTGQDDLESGFVPASEFRPQPIVARVIEGDFYVTPMGCGDRGRKCYYWNMGYCQFKKFCPLDHPREECPQKPCNNWVCPNRHRIPCRNSKNGKCSFQQKCEFLHEGLPAGFRGGRKNRKNSSTAGQGESNGSNSKGSKNIKRSSKNEVRDLVKAVENRLVFIAKAQGVFIETGNTFKEKVDKVVNDVEEAGSRINEELEHVKAKVAAVNNSINKLSKGVRKIRDDCDEHCSNQEKILEEMLAARRNETFPVQKAEIPLEEQDSSDAEIPPTDRDSSHEEVFAEMVQNLEKLRNEHLGKLLPRNSSPSGV